MKYIEVLIDRPARALDRPFTYMVPDEIEQVRASLLGCAVLVDISGRDEVGFVVTESDTFAGSFQAKPIKSVLGGSYFGERELTVARWMSRYYGCALIEALGLWIPVGRRPKLSRESDGTAAIQTPSVQEKYHKVVTLVVEPDVALSQIAPNAHIQREMVALLAKGPLSTTQLRDVIGSTVLTTARSLEKRGLVTIAEERLFREDNYAAGYDNGVQVLTSEQQVALTTIQQSTGRDVVLLHGITGSGKTEVYLSAVKKLVEQGKSAIILVPEIALTPQTVGRFRSRFGDIVAVIHSRLSEGERFDQLSRIRSGELRVVVGARSALFSAPQNLGLIVIDEEHDSSYKQGSSPRYHAREVAVKMAEEFGVPLVLGSATPSMESRYRVDAGEWRCVRLLTRPGGAELPTVQIVDLTAEFEAGNRTMFSRALSQNLLIIKEKGEKAILLLNRRGFASFVLCRKCGYVPECPHCASSLTFHATHNHLRCHHCNLILPLPKECPECGSHYLAQFGAGTQRLESELKALIPDWPVFRMDADTTTGKNGHQEILEKFGDVDSGVLLGTQMIAKGLDFPDVTLVGVVSADITLNLCEYTAGERTYQLIEQVAGRSGRAALPGNVIVQTYNPTHPALLAAATHNEIVFYESEFRNRQALRYPPFGSLCNIVVSGGDLATVENYCASLYAAVEQAQPDFGANFELLGPSECVISRINKKFRVHFLIRAPRSELLGAFVLGAVKKTPAPKGVAVSIDVDPSSLM